MTRNQLLLVALSVSIALCSSSALADVCPITGQPLPPAPCPTVAPSCPAVAPCPTSVFIPPPPVVTPPIIAPVMPPPAQPPAMSPRVMPRTFVAPPQIRFNAATLVQTDVTKIGGKKILQDYHRNESDFKMTSSEAMPEAKAFAETSDGLWTAEVDDFGSDTKKSNKSLFQVERASDSVAAAEKPLEASGSSELSKTAEAGEVSSSSGSAAPAEGNKEAAAKPAAKLELSREPGPDGISPYSRNEDAKIAQAVARGDVMASPEAFFSQPGAAGSASTYVDYMKKTYGIEVSPDLVAVYTERYTPKVSNVYGSMPDGPVWILDNDRFHDVTNRIAGQFSLDQVVGKGGYFVDGRWMGGGAGIGPVFLPVSMANGAQLFASPWGGIDYLLSDGYNGIFHVQPAEPVYTPKYYSPQPLSQQPPSQQPFSQQPLSQQPLSQQPFSQQPVFQQPAVISSSSAMQVATERMDAAKYANTFLQAYQSLQSAATPEGRQLLDLEKRMYEAALTGNDSLYVAARNAYNSAASQQGSVARRDNTNYNGKPNYTLNTTTSAGPTNSPTGINNIAYGQNVNQQALASRQTGGSTTFNFPGLDSQFTFMGQVAGNMLGTIGRVMSTGLRPGEPPLDQQMNKDQLFASYRSMTPDQQKVFLRYVSSTAAHELQTTAITVDPTGNGLIPTLKIDPKTNALSYGNNTHYVTQDPKSGIYSSNDGKYRWAFAQGNTGAFAEHDNTRVDFNSQSRQTSSTDPNDTQSFANLQDFGKVGGLFNNADQGNEKTSVVVIKPADSTATVAVDTTEPVQIFQVKQARIEWIVPEGAVRLEGYAIKGNAMVSVDPNFDGAKYTGVGKASMTSTTGNAYSDKIYGNVSTSADIRFDLPKTAIDGVGYVSANGVTVYDNKTGNPLGTFTGNYAQRSDGSIWADGKFQPSTGANAGKQLTVTAKLQ